MAVNFVLVHGASHGAWCWERMIPHLEADAQVAAVVAVELVGLGTTNENVVPVAANEEV